MIGLISAELALRPTENSAGIPLLPHVADLDRADPGRVGQRGAAHPREAEADGDVHVGEAGA